MQPGWQGRAALWALLMESVRANRRAYPALPTAWLPHAVGNSFALWLPELLAAADRALALQARTRERPTLRGGYDTLWDLCVENEAWGRYVAAAALGYILSHPRWTIYKGPRGDLQLLGFGLDAIPHSLTAFSLTHLLEDGIEALAAHMPAPSPLAPLVQRVARHPAWFSGAMLALLTLIWESGEYGMQQAELRRTGGDYDAINMQWDPEDSLFDTLSNVGGWALAVWQRRRQSTEAPAPQATTPAD